MGLTKNLTNSEMEDKFAELGMNSFLQGCEKRTINRPYFSPPAFRKRERGILYLDPTSSNKKAVAIIFYWQQPEGEESRAIIFMAKGEDEYWLNGFEDYSV